MEEEIKEYTAMIEDAYSTIKGRRDQGTGSVKSSRAESVVERAIESVERRAALYQESIEAAQRDIEQSLRFKRTMDEIIEAFDETTQKVLSMRYIDNHKWAYIGLCTCYDESRVRKLERGAVKKIAKLARFCPF